MSPVYDRSIHQEITSITHSLSMDEYICSMGAGHLPPSVENHNPMVISMCEQNHINSMVDSPAILRPAGPLHLMEIILLGGTENHQSYTATVNGNLIGYLWGQIGDGEVYNLNDREMMLEYIHVSIKRQGHGRLMVASIFDQLPVDTIYDETNDENRAFWNRIGAQTGDHFTDDMREIYEFTLSRVEYQKAIYNKGFTAFTHR